MRETLTVARFAGRLYWRDRVVLTVGLALPLGLGIGLPVMMHRLGATADTRTHLGVLAMVFTIIAFQQAAITLTARRDQLVAKRMRATGLGDGSILAGEIVNIAFQAVVQVMIISAALWAMGVLPPPAHPVLFVTWVVVGAIVLAALGAAFTVVVPRAELAPVLAMPFFMLAGLGSGGFGPLIELLPGWVAQVLGWWPGIAVADALGETYTGGTDYLPAVLRVGAGALLAALVIHRAFRWEPRR
ncbi:ABC transporter permease [Nonomuraea sp. NPDC050663]|uniref:ABC transporter permease n=1 Tax=Nonomuraea sp. NPDC050663 TaxID=3364370 RepID=UPI0037AA13DD